MNTPSLDLRDLRDELESRTPQEILAWGWEAFATRVASSSSFQTQSVPLLHMIAQVCPDMPVIFVDTGYHFPETLIFRDELERKLGLNVHTVYPDPEIKRRAHSGPEPLYLRDPDLCCRVNKVEPLMRTLAEFDGWVTGIQRHQTKHRRNSKVIERLPDGLVKINPIVSWSSHDIWTYVEHHELPVHPLFHDGYRSIGCAPCTRPVREDEDNRAGRWDGVSKTECGLHKTSDLRTVLDHL